MEGFLLPVLVFVAVYGFISLELLNKAAAAVLGVMLLVIAGATEVRTAIGYIDFETIIMPSEADCNQCRSHNALGSALQVGLGLGSVAWTGGKFPPKSYPNFEFSSGQEMEGGAMRIVTQKRAHHFFGRGMITIFIVAFVLGVGPTPSFGKVSPQGYPGSFADLVDKSSVSVVNIVAVKVMRGPAQGAEPFGSQDSMRDFFERFFGRQMPKEYRQIGGGP